MPPLPKCNLALRASKLPSSRRAIIPRSESKGPQANCPQVNRNHTYQIQYLKANSQLSQLQHNCSQGIVREVHLGINAPAKRTQLLVSMVSLSFNSRDEHKTWQKQHLEGCLRSLEDLERMAFHTGVRLHWQKAGERASALSPYGTCAQHEFVYRWCFYRNMNIHHHGKTAPTMVTTDDHGTDSACCFRTSASPDFSDKPWERRRSKSSAKGPRWAGEMHASFLENPKDSRFSHIVIFIYCNHY